MFSKRYLTKSANISTAKRLPFKSYDLTVKLFRNWIFHTLLQNSTMDIEGLQKSLSEIGVEQKIYFEDENETITNENFIELREQRETHEKLRFSDDLTKTDRFKNIEANTREVPGTNGGVKVTIAPLRNPRGQGNKIGDRLRNHRTSMAEWEKQYRKQDPDYELTSFINVRFHYAAWLQDNLDGEPFDYTFARGNQAEEAYV